MKRMIMCAQANKIDLVTYLNHLGYQPQKIRGNDYWYLSPLRQEKTPSFKVNQKLNLWYDHGIGKGGNLTDLGIQFHRCSVSEFLRKLNEKTDLNFSFHSPFLPSPKASEGTEKRLIITAVNPIKSPHFILYLSRRRIPLDIAKPYLKEVAFELNGKAYSALGFRNNSGGFELRNEHFKGSSSPKDITLIDNKCENITVFEGCFSFLSYLSLNQKVKVNNPLQLPKGHTSFLVLNSLSFFEKSRSVMESHAFIRLCLDRDTAGIKAAQQTQRWSPKYTDKSILYSQYKDLNDFLIQGQKTQQGQSIRSGRRF